MSRCRMLSPRPAGPRLQRDCDRHGPVSHAGGTIFLVLLAIFVEVPTHGDANSSGTRNFVLGLAVATLAALLGVMLPVTERVRETAYQRMAEGQLHQIYDAFCRYSA